MAGRTGTMIQYGKIVVAGDLPVDMLKQTLYEVLERCGYPEGESPSQVKKNQEQEEMLAREERELEEELRKHNEGRATSVEEEVEEEVVERVVPPWERGR